MTPAAGGATPPSRADVDADAVERFFERLAGALAQGAVRRLVLSRHHGEPADLQRLDVRPIVLRGTPTLSFTFHHRTRDVTRNLPVADALAALRGLLGGPRGLPAPANGDGAAGGFRHAHLLTAEADIELLTSRRGRATLRVRPAAAPAPGATAARAPDAADAGDGNRHRDDVASGHRDGAAAAAAGAVLQAHDRVKQRHVDLTRPFLAALGVTNAAHQLVPAMARKYRQIDKFVEVFAAAFAASPLARRTAPAAAERTDGLPDGQPLRVIAGRPPRSVVAEQPALRIVDFGAGKGYLTFALHDHLRHALRREAQVVGVELRPDLVESGNATAARLGLDGLRFEQGDVRAHSRPGAAPAAAPPDVVIALHACDTATDHAIHLGVRAGAAIVMCSPCCHRQIRPQLLKPHPLRPILQHGVHLAQQAEMLTDGLRALLLEACGYATQVFEFIALEHTNKNKMILAVKRQAPSPPLPAAELLAQIDELKRFYGIREQCLELLLRQDGWFA